MHPPEQLQRTGSLIRSVEETKQTKEGEGKERKEERKEEEEGRKKTISSVLTVYVYVYKVKKIFRNQKLHAFLAKNGEKKRVSVVRIRN